MYPSIDNSVNIFNTRANLHGRRLGIPVARDNAGNISRTAWKGTDNVHYMEVEAFQRLDPENFYRRFISNGVRPDGRQLRTVRQISVDVDVLSDNHVQGSALVGLGSTKVLTGITLKVGQPSEGTPLHGALGEYKLPAQSF